ncbi:Hsp20/alpha crystallin family protein [bacterium]|nr:Hsp20/alpha crystallin family protein [bacterium]
MSLVRWTPMHSMLRSDNMFDELWKRMWNEENDEVVQTVWSPRVDILENDNEYMLTADLPGMKREDIDITLEDGELRISGERKLERGESKDAVRVMERAHGRFVRSFRLNNSVNTEKIKASFKDGVLSLSLPKAEQKKPKKIAIQGS